MTKKQFIELLRKRLGVSFTTAKGIYETVCVTINDTLLQGEDVPFSDLGKLKVKVCAPRKWINPQSLEPMFLQGGKRVVFSQSKGFKAALRDELQEKQFQNNENWLKLYH